MTDKEKLLLAAEAALVDAAYVYLEIHGMGRVVNDMLSGFGKYDETQEERCLYLCFLAAAWDDIK